MVAVSYVENRYVFLTVKKKRSRDWEAFCTLPVGKKVAAKSMCAIQAKSTEWTIIYNNCDVLHQLFIYKYQSNNGSFLGRPCTPKTKLLKTRDRSCEWPITPRGYARAHSANMAAFFSIKRNRFDGLLLLNEHGDLHFLLHNFGVHIILFRLKNFKKNCWKGKKDIAKSVHKTVTRGCKFMTLKTTTRGTFWVLVVWNCVNLP